VSSKSSWQWAPCIYTFQHILRSMQLYPLRCASWRSADVEARTAEASELGERGAYITPRSLMSILRLSQVSTRWRTAGVSNVRLLLRQSSAVRF